MIFNPSPMTRDCVLQTPAYVPGEQPQTTDFVKLNTNENPYSPPSEIFETLQPELEKLRLYPDPISTKLRQAIAATFKLSPQQVLAGNGSDDILNIALRTFVDPNEVVTFLDLTYSLYDTITRVHGAKIVLFPTDNNFELNKPVASPDAKLIFLASPNPPLGKHIKREYIEETIKNNDAIVLIDEAYVDFADYNHLDLLDKYENVIISRTMSKSYSLAGMRVGFALASPAIIKEMDKVRDSYNLDRLAQTLATAALHHQDYFAQIWQKVRQTRSRLTQSLRDLDFHVPESDANFVFASPQWIEAEKLYSELKTRKVLVRYFKNPRIINYVRISIGTDQEIDKLLTAIADIKQ